MGIDSLKVLFTYGIAALLLVGGLLYLFLTRLDAAGAGATDRLALVGFMGIALNFVFMRETATNSARQTERAVAIQVPQPTATVTPPA
jgi:predicted lipid-binding transport protein (Tim44 family)